MTLIIYGDFNCPFSALASARADVLLAAGSHQIEWRAIQHDETIAATGEPLVGDTSAELEAETATVRSLSEPDLGLRSRSRPSAPTPPLPPPRSRPQEPTRTSSADGSSRPCGPRAAISETPRSFIGSKLTAATTPPPHGGRPTRPRCPRPITPTLVLPDGYVSRGLGALARLADLAAAPADRDDHGGEERA